MKVRYGTTDRELAATWTSPDRDAAWECILDLLEALPDGYVLRTDSTTCPRKSNGRSHGQACVSTMILYHANTRFDPLTPDDLVKRWRPILETS